ncbi:hypothetical protein F383_13949 [Gossypium arboreum]|uniref:Uncharacterized protein n=1 Tax=Gossypium arboreum TaxID=29729 RepID=A0A0B0Q019_GOSAR|nr:hypothetical protein F383_13948 [Gossypium arboreum]KHG30676.1 hypothetical protein F383_13949 [Gossypium arboreum]
MWLLKISWPSAGSKIGPESSPINHLYYLAENLGNYSKNIMEVN